MRAAVYLRVSTPAQAGDDKVSLAEQQRLCAELCERNGWELVRTYSDEGISGETVEQRPRMQALLVEATAGKFDVVVAYHQDRLARSTEAFAKIGGTLKAAGVKVATCDRGLIDLTMPADRFTFSIFAAVAEYEKERIKERMLAGRTARAKQGQFSLALSPYGYRWNVQEKKPAPVPDEIEVVREIFRLCVEEDLSTHAIAEVLRTRGIPTRTETVAKETRERGEPPKMGDGLWRDSTVRAVLRGRYSKGEWVTHEGPPEVLAKDPPPGAVDARTWAKAQHVVTRHRKNTRMQTKRPFLLSGHALCECGSAMTGRAPKPGFLYYACNRSVRSRKPVKCATGYVRADRLDGIVRGLVEELVRNPDAARNYAEQTHEEQAPRWRAEVERIGKQVGRAGMQLERAQIAYETGEYELEEFARRKAQIEADRRAWEERAGELRRLIADEEARESAVDQVAGIMRGLRGRLGSLSPAQWRQLLHRLAVRVTVCQDRRVVVEWAGEAFAPPEDGSGELVPLLGKSPIPVL